MDAWLLYTPEDAPQECLEHLHRCIPACFILHHKRRKSQKHRIGEAAVRAAGGAAGVPRAPAAVRSFLLRCTTKYKDLQHGACHLAAVCAGGGPRSASSACSGSSLLGATCACALRCETHQECIACAVRQVTAPTADQLEGCPSSSLLVEVMGHILSAIGVWPLCPVCPAHALWKKGRGQMFADLLQKVNVLRFAGTRRSGRT